MKPSRIQQEISQTRPFRSARQEAAVALLRTADLVRRYFSATVEPHGLSLQQFNVLRILRGAGEEGLPTMEIGRRMLERTPGVTRLIDRLQARGWAVREASAEDRRRVLCRITTAGLSALAATDEPMSFADERALAALSRQDVRELIRILDAARTKLDPGPG